MVQLISLQRRFWGVIILPESEKVNAGTNWSLIQGPGFGQLSVIPPLSLNQEVNAVTTNPLVLNKRVCVLCTLSAVTEGSFVLPSCCHLGTFDPKIWM